MLAKSFCYFSIIYNKNKIGKNYSYSFKGHSKILLSLKFFSKQNRYILSLSILQ